MAAARLFNKEGAELGSVELDDSVFDVPLNEPLVHQVTVSMMSSRRHGTASTKERSEVRGGGAKPFRQKGIGRARQGSIREPQMRGGGTVFGPHPRSYRKKVPIRMKRKALCCVLSDRVRNGQCIVLDSLGIDSPRTKLFMAMLEHLSPEGKPILIVTSEVEHNTLLSARNIPRVAVTTASDLNPLDVLGAQCVVIEKDAVAKLEERLT